jgi:hypothetical protein
MRILVMAAWVLALTAEHAKAQCLGDFNGDGKVTVGELITAVDSALNGCQTAPMRFVDNGDGTVTDHKTGLTWEKKTGTPSNCEACVVCSAETCSDPHNVNNTYTWSADTNGNPDGTVFTLFTAQLNGDGAGGRKCFSGHCDWRLPTVEELSGILDLNADVCDAGYPCIDPVFGPTMPNIYWSVSPVVGDRMSAIDVGFGVGRIYHDLKTVSFPARAVRSGL